MLFGRHADTHPTRLPPPSDTSAHFSFSLGIRGVPGSALDLLKSLVLQTLGARRSTWHALHGDGGAGSCCTSCTAHSTLVACFVRLCFIAVVALSQSAVDLHQSDRCGWGPSWRFGAWVWNVILFSPCWRWPVPRTAVV